MAMMTGKEYVESLRAMNLRVYMFGKRVENPVDDPILRPSVNSVRMTYDLAQGPKPPQFFHDIDLIGEILFLPFLKKGGQEKIQVCTRVHGLLPGAVIFL